MTSTVTSNTNIMIKYLTIKNGYYKEEYQNMTMLQSFKQYYTPQKYSQYLIQELNYLHPERVIDLAIGTGSLIKEAYSIWQDAKYFGNDIDNNCCHSVLNELSNIQCFNENALQYDTINKLLPSTQPIDLCLGNPPFDLILQNHDTKKILKIFNLHEIYKSKKIPAELIFTLQCIRIVSKNGTIALILPDGCFVNNYFKPFRDFLITNYDIKKIVELPDNIFTQTEAKTHILIFEKQAPSNKYITLSSVENHNNDIQITKQEALNRMDYSYYTNLKNFQSQTCIADFNIEIIRGKPKYKLIDIDQAYILHTTDLSKKQTFSNRLKSDKKLIKYQERVAKAGDIIFARVGSYCLGNIGIIKEGYFVATDCIFIIRVKNQILREKLLNSLQSPFGKSWIKSNARGVAAKHITLEDMKKFPLPIRIKHV